MPTRRPRRLCADGAFDCAALRRCVDANAAWGTADRARRRRGDRRLAWRRSRPGGSTRCDELAAALFTQKGDAALAQRASRSSIPTMPSMRASGSRCLARGDRASAQALLALADCARPRRSSSGRRFALAWDEAKQREGLIDFDDQIRRAAALLTRSGAIGEWIRYKLDRRFDHILVDEAQDTNAAQWAIIDALTDDFFAGAGPARRQAAHDVRGRRLQAGDLPLPGHQPGELRRGARARTPRQMADAGREAIRGARRCSDLGLGRSLPHRAAGARFRRSRDRGDRPRQLRAATSRPSRMSATTRPGLVTLWQPVGARTTSDDEDDGDDGPTRAGCRAPDRGWPTRSPRRSAAWMRRRLPAGQGRAAQRRAGRLMVLVRKRRELAGLIVARLHARGRAGGGGRPAAARRAAGGART